MTVSDAFATVLRSAREELNTAFSHARRQYPALDAATFSALLAGWLDPLVQAVHARAPQATSDVVRVGFEALLELAGQGVPARSAGCERCFTALLPGLAEHVARDPARVIGGLTNAVYNLDAAGANTALWIERVAALGPRCVEAEHLFQLGVLCAWRSGLAHYRSAALMAADRLPAALSCAVLDLPNEQAWPEARAALARDPWYIGTSTAPRVAALAGAFRGFGGLFSEPPRVRAWAEHFIVHSGDAAWLLTADAYGATFHHANEGEQKQADGARPRAGISVTGRTLTLGSVQLELPIAGELTSLALTSTTLALTSSHSHAVVLVSLGALP